MNCLALQTKHVEVEPLPETVPCKWCHTPTLMVGTGECDACWELRTRIEHKYGIASKMINKPVKLTPAQIWYVANVYPETIEPEAAEVEFQIGLADKGVDESYWIAVAKVVNKMAARGAK